MMGGGVVGWGGGYGAMIDVMRGRRCEAVMEFDGTTRRDHGRGQQRDDMGRTAGKQTGGSGGSAPGRSARGCGSAPG
jgi:hypothetical protein